MPLVVRQRSYERPDGRHAGVAWTVGGGFGMKVMVRRGTSVGRAAKRTPVVAAAA